SAASSVYAPSLHDALPILDTDYLDLMAEAIAGIGWDGRSNLTPAANPNSGSPWAHGRGMALSLRHGSQGGGRAYALVTMDAAGRDRKSTRLNSSHEWNSYA